MSEKRAVHSILHFGSEMVFKDASTYTCILQLNKIEKEEILFSKLNPKNLLNSIVLERTNYSFFDSNKWQLQNDKVAGIFSKMANQPYIVKDIFQYISQGVVSVGDDIFLLKGEIAGPLFKGFSKRLNSKIEIESSIVKPLLKGEDVKKYAPLNHSYYVLYPHVGKENKTQPLEEEVFKNEYPKAYAYILPFKEELVEKKKRYKTNPKFWYSLHRSREISLFEQEKIITPETSLGTNLTLDTQKYYHNTQVYSLIKKEEFDISLKVLLAILNTSLFWFFLKSTGAVLRGGYFRFKTKYLEPFPMPEIPSKSKQDEIKIKVNYSLKYNKEIRKVLESFRRLIIRKFEIEKLSKNLQKWHTLTFAEFVKELKKKKIKLSLSDELEWETFFESEKAKAQQLQTTIDQTDKEIDQMVYELYGLTKDYV